MKLIVLKELPQGQQPGELLDTTDAIATVLITVGGARRATDAEIRRHATRDKDSITASDVGEAAPAPVETSAKPSSAAASSRRHHQRRDLTAVDSD